MWRGSPCTGISRPTIAPTSRDHAPAAHTTVSVAIVPCGVRTPVMRPPALLDPGRRAALQDLRAARDGRRRVALHDRLGAHVAVARAERRRQHAVELQLRHDLGASAGVSSREGTPWACCTASASRNVSDVGRALSSRKR